VSIVFVGFASSGKSATAYGIARALDLKFVDLDKEIEVRYFLERGRESHYRRIILNEGEEYFFQLENRVLNELTRLQDLSIAPGGGAPLRRENRDLLAKLGTVVYLQCAPEVLLGRMKAKGPPLFLIEDPSLEQLTDICNQRHPVYEAMADVTIDNSMLSVEETVASVLAALHRRKE
jgi:shikimate kinase